jgi:hypothetical protein
MRSLAPTNGAPCLYGHHSSSIGIFAHGGLFQPHARAPSLDYYNSPWAPGGGRRPGLERMVFGSRPEYGRPDLIFRQADQLCGNFDLAIEGGGQTLGSCDRLVDIRWVEARLSPAPLGRLFVSLNHTVVLHRVENQRRRNKIVRCTISRSEPMNLAGSIHFQLRSFMLLGAMISCVEAGASGTAAK